MLCQVIAFVSPAFDMLRSVDGDDDKKGYVCMCADLTNRCPFIDVNILRKIFFLLLVSCGEQKEPLFFLSQQQLRR